MQTTLVHIPNTYVIVSKKGHDTKLKYTATKAWVIGFLKEMGLPSPAKVFWGSLLQACFSRIFRKSLMMGRLGFTYINSSIPSYWLHSGIKYQKIQSLWGNIIFMSRWVITITGLDIKSFVIIYQLELRGLHGP